MALVTASTDHPFHQGKVSQHPMEKQRHQEKPQLHLAEGQAKQKAGDNNIYH